MLILYDALCISTWMSMWYSCFTTTLQYHNTDTIGGADDILSTVSSNN